MKKKKNILYIHQYFFTPYEAGANRSYWVAKSLVDSGYNVTMLTAKNNLKKNYQEKIIDGINIVYFNVRYDQNMSILIRFISFFSFMSKALIYSLKKEKIDLVYATSTPLSVGFIPLILKKIKKIPYVFEVRDLWPEVPIQMGAIRNKFLIFLLKIFEKKIYNNSSHVIALSPGMAAGVKTLKSNTDEISVVPNMSKIDLFWQRKKNTGLIKKFNLSIESFKIIHFGAIGISNGLNYLMKAANEMKNLTNIEIILCGEGAQKKKLIEYCKINDINNVKFLGNFSSNTLSEIVNFCDLSIVSFKNIPILKTNSPNKLFDSLSAQKPIIVNSNGWTKKLVEEHECGVYVDPLDHKDLVNKIMYLKNNPKLVDIMGKNSRKLAEKVFDKKILCKKILKIIDNVLNN